MKRLAASFLWALAACSTAPAPEPPKKQAREEMESQHRLARFALEARRYDQAAFLYDQALQSAYVRDDAGAIGELGYELAVVRLRRGEPRLAELRVNETIAELDRRGAHPFAELRLVGALAVYAQDRPDAARAMAEAIVETAGVAPATVARAWHLRGMIAADRGDQMGLARALSALSGTTDLALVADRFELTARQQALGGTFAAALATFERTATLRREIGDYTGMARALVFGAEAAALSGRRGDAANLYLRAARSAVAEGRRDEATAWLQAARHFAAESGRSDLVREAGLPIDDVH